MKFKPTKTDRDIADYNRLDRKRKLEESIIEKEEARFDRLEASQLFMDESPHHLFK